MEDIYESTTEGPVFNETESPVFKSIDETNTIILNILSAVFFILGTTGNFLVILAVLLSQKLRTATNAFVVNLSVADLLTSLVIPIHAVIRSLLFSPAGKWVTDVGLGVIVFLNTSVGCSILTLTCIALNRLLLITRPTTIYPKIFTPKKIAVWIVLTWLIPCPLAYLPPVVLDEVVSANAIRAVALIPLMITIVCYVLIWRYVNHHTKTVVSDPAVSNESTPENIAMTIETNHASNVSSDTRDYTRSPSGLNSASISHLNRRQTEITKNMFYVVCAFVLCINPLTVCLNFTRSVEFQYFVSVVLFNSCINPLIYATKHRDFKTVFGCILRRQWQHIPEPSGFLKAMRRNECCGRKDPSA